MNTQLCTGWRCKLLYVYVYINVLLQVWSRTPFHQEVRNLPLQAWMVLRSMEVYILLACTCIIVRLENVHVYPRRVWVCSKGTLSVIIMYLLVAAVDGSVVSHTGYHSTPCTTIYSQPLHGHCFVCGEVWGSLYTTKMFDVIGPSLSKPHTSGTALQDACVHVCIVYTMYVCLRTCGHIQKI